MSLPLKYVKEIHSRLAVRYGSAWRGKWAEVPQEALEADWSDQLDGMTPAGIRKALESLPAEFPPTASAFRLLGAIREEAAPIPALPAPDPVGMRRIASAIADGIKRAAAARDAMSSAARARECMDALIAKVEAGTASPAQRDFLRRAEAGRCVATVAQLGDFTPPPVECLPPAMRAELERSHA